ncbi:hypothetical protein [Syntrophomonas erecta]
MRYIPILSNNKNNLSFEVRGAKGLILIGVIALEDSISRIYRSPWLRYQYLQPGVSAAQVDHLLPWLRCQAILVFPVRKAELS